MSDWPDQFTETSHGRGGILTPCTDTPMGDMFIIGGKWSSTATVWTANLAVYMPVHVSYPCTVTQMAINVATQAGNVDVGIYDWENNRQISSGTTAVAVAGVQVFNITDTYLEPGWYKFALSSDSATAAFQINNSAAVVLRGCGVQQQSTAFVLPNPATPTTYATTKAPLVVASYRSTTM